MKQFFSAAILALLMLCGTLPARAAIVGFAGPSAVQAGAQFDVAVRVDAISSLYAYNLSVRYDPLALRFVAQAEGAFLQAGGATYFIEGTVDEPGGLISFTGASLIGPHSGVAGGGGLFTLTFAALDVADRTLASFSLEDALFLAPDLEEIGVGWGAGLQRAHPRRRRPGAGTGGPGFVAGRGRGHGRRAPAADYLPRRLKSPRRKPRMNSTAK